MTRNETLNFARFPHPDSRLFYMFLKSPDCVIKVIRKLEDPHADYSSAAFTFFDYENSIMHLEMNVVVKGIHGLVQASVLFKGEDVSNEPDAIEYLITTETFRTN